MNDINRPEQLEWEREWDGIKKLKEWIIDNTLATEAELNDVEMESERVHPEQPQPGHREKIPGPDQAAGRPFGGPHP